MCSEMTSPPGPTAFGMHLDLRARLLRFRLAGWWDAATIAAYREELLRNLARLPASDRTFDLVADLTDFVPQTQEIAAMHGDIMAKGRGVGLRFAASVVSSPLVRLQIARVAASPDFGYVATDAEALEWIASRRAALPHDRYGPLRGATTLAA